MKQNISITEFEKYCLEAHDKLRLVRQVVRDHYSDHQLKRMNNLMHMHRQISEEIYEILLSSKMLDEQYKMI